MSIQMDFTGKRVWVTGAARGIGEQIARHFLTQGAEVVGFDREFANPDLPYPCVTLDISRPEQVEAVCRQQLEENPKLDVLVNAAGILRMGNTEDLSVDDWHQCINVNASGRFTCSAPCCRTSRRSAAGRSSASAPTPRTCRARRWRPTAPQGGADQPEPLCGAGDGAVRRALQSGVAGLDRHADAARHVADRRCAATHHRRFPEMFKLGIPLGKIARPDEIANAVLFTASDLASHITMQDIVIDGGATLAA